MGCPFASNRVVFKDKELDVSKFVPVHPGGDAINEFINSDITDVFLAMHGPDSRAHRLVKNLPVTKENINVKVSEVQEDFRDLAAKLHHDTLNSRWFNLVNWLGDLIIALLIGWVGLYALIWSDWGSIRKYFVGGLALALMFFQIGWLTHDIAHKTITQDYRIIKPLTLFWGSFMIGYSYDWWRCKHNRRHHPLTNVIGKDEDIDTMPLIAWDERIAENNWFVRNQHILAWPLLCFARLSWRLSSITHAFEHKQWSEVIFILLHYVFYAKLLMMAGLSVISAIIFAIVVDMVSGFLTGFVFLQSHNAKQVYPERETDFWTHQIMTTSNIHNNFINNKFSGYLNLQIEHHLFPWLPRRMLSKAQPEVKRICKKHGLSYYEFSWSESTALIYRHLKHIARRASNLV